MSYFGTISQLRDGKMSRGRQGRAEVALANLLCLVGLALTAGLMAPVAARGADGVELSALSSPAQYVTGSQVLVSARIPPGLSASDLQFRLNGAPVRVVVRAEDGGPGAAALLVQGLAPGRNTLTVRSRRGAGGQLVLDDHSESVPLFAGPQLPFFACQTAESGLGPPTDANCSARARIDYVYRDLAGKFKPLSDRAARPSDLAFIKAARGDVPYIVRVESGISDRSIYRIAVLDDPTRASPSSEAWRPGPGWNRRLVIFFGGGCGMHYGQGGDQIDQVLSDTELSRGFAYAVSTGLVNQQFCSPLLQAETLMRLKEHVIKAYGLPVWTLGSGGSGGAIQQMDIAQMFPRLLDGLQPGAAFPDAQIQAPLDCYLLRHVYAADPGRWTQAKQAAVDGATTSTCADWSATFATAVRAVPPAPLATSRLDMLVSSAGGALLPTTEPCGVADQSRLYDLIANPHGLRCSQYDFQANQLGRDAIGRARRPLDNVGVQYGLAALNAGDITLDDFIDLNARIGGFDQDGNTINRRSQGDLTGIRNAYATGLMNGGGSLAATPIILQRAYFDRLPAGSAAAIHDRMQDFIIRERLMRANGTTGNLVIWTTAPAAGFDIRARSLDLASRWLDAMAADPAALTPAKVLKDRPTDAVDACWDSASQMITEPAVLSGAGRCNALYPVHGEPRMVAGGPVTNDVLKCALRPIRYADYPAKPTPEQFERLRAVFPRGVCDYAKPGLGQTPFEGPLSVRSR
jgi:hypothetical protein